MKIEVGQYVRTKKGSIAKVLGVDVFEEGKGMDISNLEAVCFDNIVNDIDKDIYCGCFNEVFKECKTSFNIIDLIEVGDILHSKNDNQYWTVENYLYEKGRCVNIEWKVLDSNEEFLENIDEIITKEQAKSVSYKVGE